jgi:hypothetical protein
MVIFVFQIKIIFASMENLLFFFGLMLFRFSYLVRTRSARSV